MKTIVLAVAMIISIIDCLSQIQADTTIIDSLSQVKVDSTQIDSLSQVQVDTVLRKAFGTGNFGLLGDVSLISLALERVFVLDRTFIITGKLGIGLNVDFQLAIFAKEQPPSQTYVTYPHHITACYGNGSVFVELGLGGTIIRGSIDKAYCMYTIIGLRCLSLKSKSLNFRFFFMFPVAAWGTGAPVVCPIGISFGGKN